MFNYHVSASYILKIQNKIFALHKVNEIANKKYIQIISKTETISF